MSLNQENKIQIGDKVVGLDEKITTENEEYVYGYLMEVLTGGLYPNKFDVIREYVQNSVSTSNLRVI